QLHRQSFRFGASELDGLKIFFSTAAQTISPQAVGNCVSCHPAPAFTDFRFHNTGASQAEYDKIHGARTFAALALPGLAQRTASFDAFLPPSPAHPGASGVFRTAPAATLPGYTDLGVWNVFANPDMPAPQSALTQILCTELALDASQCTAEQV